MRLSFRDIVEGYLNLVKTWLGVIDAEVKEVAKERKKICDSCPTQSRFCGVDYCDLGKGGCGCVGAAKRLCVGDGCECPLGRWASTENMMVGHRSMAVGEKKVI